MIRTAVSALGNIRLVIVGLALLTACSSGQKDSGNKGDTQKSKPTQPAPRLDPTSAALYPAQRKAKARDFEVTLLNGNTFRLSEQEGKVVLLNIWATWCPPCHEETPDFVDLYNKYKDDGLVILGVSIDEQGESVVRPFMEKYDVDYPMFIDDGTVMDKYGPTMGVPTTYVIDKEGNLKYFAVGALTKQELEPRIRKMLDI